MLAFATRNGLDVAACGFDFVDARTGETYSQRILEQDMVLTSRKDFGTCFPIYHQFMRTNWAKLFSIAVTKKCDAGRIPPLFYGVDTLYTQEMFRNVNRVGILAKSLHKYYVSPKSRSYNWNPLRTEADRVLNNSACSYLIDKCESVSHQNRCFLQCVYANAVSDTLRVIGGSVLTPAEKLREYAGIAACSITLAAYRQNKDDSVMCSRSLLLQMALNAGVELNGQSDDNLRTVVQTLLPRCGPADTGQNLPLIVRDQSLLQPFLADEPESVLRRLLRLIAEKYGVKKYNLVKMVQTLAAGSPLLSRITNTAFLRRYGDIYLSAWRGEYYEMLEEMSGLLLDGQVSGGTQNCAGQRLRRVICQRVKNNHIASLFKRLSVYFMIFFAI